ncbi:MAG: transposase [Ruminococcus sp.]|nr:transposase [Ruminococcus sp.]
MNNEKKLSDFELEYIIVRMIDNAKDIIDELNKNPNDDFYRGKALACYEFLDTLQNELIARELSLKDFGVDFNVDDLLNN